LQLAKFSEKTSAILSCYQWILHQELLLRVWC